MVRFSSLISYSVSTPKTIDNFIVDFYCHKAKLVIEIDGASHYTEDGLEYDKERTAILNGLGLSVIRFSNSKIDKSFDEACQSIDNFVQKKIRQ